MRGRPAGWAGGPVGAHWTRSRRGMESWTSAPSPGAERMTAGAAEARHAGTDRLGDALAVLGHRIGVETPAAVPDVEHDRVRLHLGVDRDLVGTGPLGRVHRGLPGRVEQGAQRVVECAVPHHDHLDRDAVVGLHLALQEADALGQHRGVLADGSRRPALEQPGPQLALLGPGQAHHVLRVVGRALDERQGLEHRVVDVGRHLGPLLGQGAGLALGDEVAHQAEPPGPEDDDAGRHDEHGATDGRSAAAVVWPSTSSDDPSRPR